jgi:carbon storage regulator
VLVLTRRLNERILLPDLGVAIGVVALKPSLVRLGIEAPSHVTVLREEVHRRALPPSDRGGRLSSPEPSLSDQLTAVGACLDLLRRQLNGAPSSELRATAARLGDAFEALQRELQEVLTEVGAGDPPPCPLRVTRVGPVHASGT